MHSTNRSNRNKTSFVCETICRNIKNQNKLNNKRYYEARLIKALDYINNNLENKITVELLSRESHFSSFHFQRIYKSLLGETPYDTVLRLRLEKAVFLLKNEPEISLNEIAFQVGFPSYENFSRQFKQRFKFTPSQFQKDRSLQNSRIYQENQPNDFYSYILKSREAVLKEFSVKIEKMPNIKIAFVRAIFGLDGTELIDKYNELITWAESHCISYQGDRKRFGMSIDSIEVTPASKFRYDFAIALGEFVGKNEGIIEMGNIPEGNYATIHCIGKLEDVAQAWDFLYKKWLPESNYKPKHFPAIEEFVKGPEEIGWENFNIKCRIPIERI